MNNGEVSQIDWHSGFAGGLSLSLRRYYSEIQIERELPLTKEPLKMDFLVVKKNEGVVIDNALGRGFLKYNIIEYKNPDDELNIDVAWKVIGYAAIYKSSGRRVNEIPSEDITVTIVRTRKPVKLFKYLRKQQIDVICERDGVYRIDGLVSIPCRVIVLREVKDKQLLALKVMERNADENDIREFLEEAKMYNLPGDKHDADAVIQVSSRANIETYERLKGDERMCEALRELMADELKEAEINGENRGVKQGIEQRDIEKISEMLNMGRKPEDIAEFCNYPLQQVKNVQKSLKKK